MMGFTWGFNGQKFSEAAPLKFNYGERLRIVLVNDTMMTHPIHLHGMWSDLEDEHGNFLVRKHTVDMPPGSRRSYRVTADADYSVLVNTKLPAATKLARASRYALAPGAEETLVELHRRRWEGKGNAIDEGAQQMLSTVSREPPCPIRGLWQLLQAWVETTDRITFTGNDAACAASVASMNACATSGSKRIW